MTKEYLTKCETCDIDLMRWIEGAEPSVKPVFTCELEGHKVSTKEVERTDVLKGKKIIFRPIEREDLEHLRDWRNSPDLLPFVREYRLLNMENQREWFDSITDDRNTIMFMICLATAKITDLNVMSGEIATAVTPSSHFGDLKVSSGKLATGAVTDTLNPIGVCGLTHIDWKERSAEVSIYIGQMGERGKGYGEDALRLLLDYGFKNLGLHRIWGEIWEYNKANIKLFEKVGFKNEGRLREVHFWDGRYHDSLIYSILKSEYV